MGRPFPYLPQQPGYNRRLRALATTVGQVAQLLAWDTTIWSDDVWAADSTPVECGRSQEIAGRSEPAGWAQYDTAPVIPLVLGLRLHLVTYTACRSPARWSAYGFNLRDRHPDVL